MKILVSNDDGYQSPGIRILADYLRRTAEMTVVAPDRDRSGSSIILNVNVPDLPYEALSGLRATRLGHRHKAEPVVKERDPCGREIYWVGPAGSEADAGPGTDFSALRQGYVSITPLQVDLTRHTALEGVQQWLAG